MLLSLPLSLSDNCQNRDLFALGLLLLVIYIFAVNISVLSPHLKRMTLLTILCLWSNNDKLSFHTEIPAFLHDQASYDVSSTGIKRLAHLDSWWLGSQIDKTRQDKTNIYYRYAVVQPVVKQMDNDCCLLPTTSTDLLTNPSLVHAKSPPAVQGNHAGHRSTDSCHEWGVG